MIKLAVVTFMLCAAIQGATPPKANILTHDAKRVCVRGYAHTVRNVPESLKRAVYRRDHATKVAGKCCEIDHIISLELGGSNAIGNLHAEPYPEAYTKDSVENYLHREVCAGRMTLTAAQNSIWNDWPAAYAQYLAVIHGHTRK